MSNLKRCHSCGETKIVEDFYSNRAKKGGRESSCKICFNKRIGYPKSSELQVVYIPHQLAVEEWRQVVVDGEQLPYLISDCGRVLIKRTNKIANPSFSQRGYPQIVLTNNRNKRRIARKIHILVGRAFLENPNNYRELNHKDGNKLYPHKSNLEYCTSKDNIGHAIKNGLRRPFDSFNHPQSISVLDTATNEIYPSISYVSEKFGLNYHTLYEKITNRKRNNTRFIEATI